MMRIKISEDDFLQVERVAAILNEVGPMNPEELFQSLEEINQFQPLMIRLLLGYKDRLREQELNEFARDLIIIWKFFDNNVFIRKNPLTEEFFMEVDKKNIEFMKYLSGEHSGTSFDEACAADLESLESKALFTGMLFRYNEIEAIKQMDTELKGEILLGVKSLIECFSIKYSN